VRVAGLEVERLKSASGLARLIVSGDGDRTEVDVAGDARLFPAERASRCEQASNHALDDHANARPVITEVRG